MLYSCINNFKVSDLTHYWLLVIFISVHGNKNTQTRSRGFDSQCSQRQALTQRDLGATVGVKASHIAYIESEQRNPSLALLRRLADTLGLNRQEMLFLVHPDAKHLTQDVDMPKRKGGKPDGWRRFATNRALLRRHRVTPGELKVLRQVECTGADIQSAQLPVRAQLDSDGERRRLCRHLAICGGHFSSIIARPWIFVPAGPRLWLTLNERSFDRGL